MLKKIISGGQTGADQAALDLAMKFNIPHGGWIPRGRKTEAGVLPARYRLKEMPTADYPARTRQNILDADGTVIISRGALTGGSRLTQSFARKAGRPNIHIDLAGHDIFEAAMILHAFILENQIQVLNVAGPRASHDPGIYFEVRSIMESMLYLGYLASAAEDEISAMVPDLAAPRQLPLTQDEALARLESDLPLKAKAYLGRATPHQIGDLYFGFLDYVRERCGLDHGDSLLYESLRQGTDREKFTIEDGVMILVKALKRRFENAYTLRLVP